MITTETQNRKNILLENIPNYTREDLYNKLFSVPVSRLEVIKLPMHLRLDYVHQIANTFFIPSPYHINLATSINSLLRYNYLRSNPNDPETWRNLYQLKEIESKGILVSGLSGTGKSSIIRRCLSLYPPIIKHANFPCLEGGLNQVPYLSFTIGSLPDIKGFVEQLFKEWANALNISNDQLPDFSVKTRSVASMSISKFISHCRSHHLGLMHIDEVQSFFEQQSLKNQIKNISSTNPVQRLIKERDDVALKALLQIYNTAGWGLILSTTPDGVAGLSRRLAVSARIASAGNYTMPLLKKNDSYTEFFIQTLFKYQYVEHPLILNENIFNFILDKTAGIYRSILKLWHCAHEVAYSIKDDYLDFKHFEIAYDQHFSLNDSLHEAIKENNYKHTSLYQDC